MGVVADGEASTVVEDGRPALAVPLSRYTKFDGECGRRWLIKNLSHQYVLLFDT